MKIITGIICVIALLSKDERIKRPMTIIGGTMVIILYFIIPFLKLWKITGGVGMNFRKKKEQIRQWIKDNVKGEDYILIGKQSINLTGYFDSGRIEYAEINSNLQFQIILDNEEPIIEITYDQLKFVKDMIDFLLRIGRWWDGEQIIKMKKEK